MRLFKRNVLLNAVNSFVIDYPTASNINYLWNFGILSAFCLMVQIITGIFLAMHYVPNIELAFNSVEHIMRDLNYGWLLRYIHSNGASMFFIVMYIHMFRGIYYGSYTYPRETVWHIGVSLFVLSVGTAFLGYVLPWGQMSLWGATVITNLVSAIPVIGKDIVHWIWGGFSVNNATLNRLFSIHYLLPFILLALVLLHLILLHIPGGNNPLGIDSTYDRISFHPYFSSKDIFGIFVFLILFSYFVFFNPNKLGDADNYIRANPMVTPPHIVPEWYVLPFYAILRSIPSKLWGLVAMLLAFVVLYLLPYLHTSKIRSSSFRPLNKILFWFIVVNFLILFWIGGCPIEEPYYTIGAISTTLYFVFFTIFMPLLGYIENILFKYNISL